MRCCLLSQVSLSNAYKWNKSRSFRPNHFHRRDKSGQYRKNPRLPQCHYVLSNLMLIERKILIDCVFMHPLHIPAEKYRKDDSQGRYDSLSSGTCRSKLLLGFRNSFHEIRRLKEKFDDWGLYAAIIRQQQANGRLYDEEWIASSICRHCSILRRMAWKFFTRRTNEGSLSIKVAMPTRICRKGLPARVRILLVWNNNVVYWYQLCEHNNKIRFSGRWSWSRYPLYRSSAGIQGWDGRAKMSNLSK